MSARASKLVPWVVAVAAVAVALVPACSTPNVSLATGTRTYTAERYNEVLARWTRTAHDYTVQGLDDNIAVTATYESWDFRWAYVVRYASDFRLTTVERSRLLQTSLESASHEHEFYVALYTQNRRWGALERPTSAWRVLLVNDHQMEVPPSAIEPISRPGALERAYFPYITVWRQAFRVRFPTRTWVPGRGEVETLNGSTRFFILRFSGPLGSTDLRWDVDVTES